MAIGVGNGIGVPFTKGGGGAAAFSFGQTLHCDGVNDHATIGGTSATVSSTCFNPYNDVDWFCSHWLKSGTGTRFNNNSSVWGVRQFVGTYAQAKLQFINAVGGSYMRIKTSTVSITSNVVITSASQLNWHLYSATVEVNVGVDVTVKFYVDGVLIDTKTGTQTTVTDTTVNLTLGAARNGDYFSGYLNQVILGYGTPGAAEFLSSYNGGKGQSSAVSFTAFTYDEYLFTEAAGTTTGNLTESGGGDSVGLVGFVAPYGLTTDTP